MSKSLEELKRVYAELLITIGVNLQPGECVNLMGEPSARDFMQMVVESAYRHGAKYVDVIWEDTRISRARYTLGKADDLDYVPAFEVTRRHNWKDETYARIVLAGQEFPDIFNDVDPALIQRFYKARRKHTSFYIDAQMANEIPWCVASVPTPHWAKKVFPNLNQADAMDALWRSILKLVRADTPDPVAAWAAHDATLIRVSQTLNARKLTAVRFVDGALADDGRPRTDLTVGLTAAPNWVAASSAMPNGRRFFPNMPTEEVFTTPHRERTSGYARTSMPAYLLGRELHEAYFRFENSEVVEYSAAKGGDALKQLMDTPGAKRLGEVALVDVRSPIKQTGLLFYETLFDENAASHIAFGKAYPEGMLDAATLTKEQQLAAGLNAAEAHEDLMIGSATMNVYGVFADGTESPIMRNGQFMI